MTKKEPALPPGIDRRPSGGLRVRVYEFGKRRQVGTYGDLAAALQARDDAQHAYRGLDGRTHRSDAAWHRRTTARLRKLAPDERPVVDAVLDGIDRQRRLRNNA